MAPASLFPMQDLPFQWLKVLIHSKYYDIQLIDKIVAYLISCK